MPSDADRELAADVAYLLRNVETFEGVYALSHQGRVRLFVVVEDHSARVRAAARLSVLSAGAEVEIVTSRSRRGEHVELSEDDLAAAARRDETRRAGWPDAPPQIESHVVNIAQRSVFIVSAAAEEHARIIRSRSNTFLSTFGTSDASRALDVLALHHFPDLVLIDRDLDGAEELERKIRDAYPSRFSDGWQSSKLMQLSQPFDDETLARVLSALGAEPRQEGEPEQPFSRVRIVVVEGPFADLRAEIAAAAPGAAVTVAALSDIVDRRFVFADLVVIGWEEDGVERVFDWLARGNVGAYRLLIATSRETDELEPALRGRIVPRPVTSEVVRRAIGLPVTPG